jgi:UDP-glucose 4-epimerase
MCEAEKSGIKRFVYAGSAASYDPLSSPYAMSKLLAEEVLKRARIEVVLLRFFNIYGKGQNPSYSGVIPKFIDDIKYGNPVTIYGDGKQTRDFIYIDDVCEAITCAMDYDDVPLKTVIDVGLGTAITINYLSGKIGGALFKSVNVEYAPEREEVRHSVADTTLCRGSLKFIPKFDLDRGLMEMLDD